MSELKQNPERLRHETKAAYLAAIHELFALLAVPASEKGPDHKDKVMAANNKCGETRLIMIATWEGEE